MGISSLAALTAVSVAARGADDATPGYTERVLHWTVKNDETCDDIAAALYGDAKHRALLERYNAIRCAAGKLKDGTTLIVPAKVTSLPTARLRSLRPDVRSRPPGAGWQPATPGMPLMKNHSVNTMEKAQADILFVDRTRVVLAEHTLVIIYGTAKQTAVKKTPPTVELESGELQAGLAALRGKPVTIDVLGGEVSAESRDTSVRAKPKRATVSVFDGHANVSSAGQKVRVPANHGSAFERQKPPTPARPLPPAPRWAGSPASGVALSPPEGGTVSAGWEPVPNARQYRVELSRDAAFGELVAREEVPGDIRAFRAEKLPPGAYFLRVRAIDNEDFLGIASDPLGFAVAEARAGALGLERGVLRASPYGTLELGAFAGLEVAVDDGAFVSIPARIDLGVLEPSSLTFRVAGTSISSRYAVEYVLPAVSLDLEPRGTTELEVVARFADRAGVDLSRVRPSLRVRRGPTVSEHRLAARAGTLHAKLVELAPGPLLVELVDGQGRVLARSETSIGVARDAPSGPELRPALGVSAPLAHPSPFINVTWWTPTVRSAGAVSSTGYVSDGELGATLAARASGSLGAFGFEGLVATRELEGPAADGSAWWSVRWRPVRSGRLELGPAAQVGVPLTAASPAARFGLGFALGAPAGAFGWVVNVGGRAPLEESSDRQPGPDLHGFLLAGGTYDARPWLRSYALFDAHALVEPMTEELLGRGGLTLGAEIGEAVFGGLSLRGSPWGDTGGHFMGQLAVGVRERR